LLLKGHEYLEVKHIRSYRIR